MIWPSIRGSRVSPREVNKTTGHGLPIDATVTKEPRAIPEESQIVLALVPSMLER